MHVTVTRSFMCKTLGIRKNVFTEKIPSHLEQAAQEGDGVAIHGSI